MFGPIGGIDTDCSSAGTKPSSEWPKNDCIQTIPTRDLAGKTHHVPVGILWGATDRANREDSPSVVSLHGSKLFYVFPLHWTDERCRNYDKAYPIYKVQQEVHTMTHNTNAKPNTVTLEEKLADAVKRAQKIADGRNQPVKVVRARGDMHEDMRVVWPSGWPDSSIDHHRNRMSPHVIFLGARTGTLEPQYVDLPHSIGEGQAIAKALSKPIEVVGQNLQCNQGPFDQNVQAVHVYDTDEGPVLTIWVPHKGHHFVKRGKDGEYIPGRQRDAEVLKEYVRAL